MTGQHNPAADSSFALSCNRCSYTHKGRYCKGVGAGLHYRHRSLHNCWGNDGSHWHLACCCTLLDDGLRERLPTCPNNAVRTFLGKCAVSLAVRECAPLLQHSMPTVIHTDCVSSARHVFVSDALAVHDIHLVRTVSSAAQRLANTGPAVVMIASQGGLQEANDVCDLVRHNYIHHFFRLTRNHIVVEAHIHLATSAASHTTCATLQIEADATLAHIHTIQCGSSCKHFFAFCKHLLLWGCHFVSPLFVAMYVLYGFWNRAST